MCCMQHYSTPPVPGRLCVYERERERERDSLSLCLCMCAGTVFQQWVCTGYCLWRSSGTSGCFLSLHWLLYCSSVTLTPAHSVFFQAVTWNSFLLKSPMSRTLLPFRSRLCVETQMRCHDLSNAMAVEPQQLKLKRKDQLTTSQEMKNTTALVIFLTSALLLCSICCSLCSLEVTSVRKGGLDLKQ